MPQPALNIGGAAGGDAQQQAHIDRSLNVFHRLRQLIEMLDRLLAKLGSRAVGGGEHGVLGGNATVAGGIGMQACQRRMIGEKGNPVGDAVVEQDFGRSQGLGVQQPPVAAERHGIGNLAKEFVAKLEDRFGIEFRNRQDVLPREVFELRLHVGNRAVANARDQGQRPGAANNGGGRKHRAQIGRQARDAGRDQSLHRVGNVERARRRHHGVVARFANQDAIAGEVPDRFLQKERQASSHFGQFGFNWF
jgi:hypothetical protein